MVEVVLLAVALSMDAFAVSIGLGARHKHRAWPLAFEAGLYFGIFQALMPLAGYVGGKPLLGWIAGYAPWVAFGLLGAVGVKMISEAFGQDIEAEVARTTHRVMVVLALATSIDALAAGFSLTLLPVNGFVACLVIGATTFGFSWGGVFVGARFGTWLESKAEVLGGVVLILIGFRILFL